MSLLLSGGEFSQEELEGKLSHTERKAWQAWADDLKLANKFIYFQ